MRQMFLLLLAGVIVILSFPMAIAQQSDNPAIPDSLLKQIYHDLYSSKWGGYYNGSSLNDNASILKTHKPEIQSILNDLQAQNISITIVTINQSDVPEDLVNYLMLESNTSVLLLANETNLIAFSKDNESSILVSYLMQHAYGKSSEQRIYYALHSLQERHFLETNSQSILFSFLVLAATPFIFVFLITPKAGMTAKMLSCGASFIFVCSLAPSSLVPGELIFIKIAKAQETGQIVSLQAGGDKAPVLFFSDLIDGPKSGLGDGLGQGAIVTIWGKNLGNSQGSSKVYIRDSSGIVREPAYIYYWKNADGQLPGGPADLYTYHKMQEISFSIPSALADGAGKIYVTIGGINSNELDFTVRSTGTIYWISPSGSNSNPGTYGSPFKSFGYFSGANMKMSSGDIVYGLDGTDEATYGVNGSVYQKSGSDGAMCAYIAYPGAVVKSNGFSDYSAGSGGPYSQYWVFSKIYHPMNASGGGGIDSFGGSRIIANEITNSDCMTGAAAGAMLYGGYIGTQGTVGNPKYLGNYIHDWGCPTTAKLEHTTYFTNRSQHTFIAPEVGWNLLKDNKAPYGLHFYDEGGNTADYSGILKIHDNVVINQDGDGIDITNLAYSPEQCGTYGEAGYHGWSFDAYIYNNLLINVGLPHDGGGGIGNASAMAFTGECNHANIYLYNNTIYGYSYSGRNDGALTVYTNTARSYSFAGTWHWANNIIVDTVNEPYYIPAYFKTPATHSNNIWYNGGDGNPASPPSWDTYPLTANPLFVDPVNGDFRLQTIALGFTQDSPACGAGDPSIGPDIGAIPCITASGPDTTPPSRYNPSPTGALQAGTTQATLSLSTSEPATCRYSTSPGVSYPSMASTFTTTGGTTHSRLITGLQNGTSYSYYIRCNDTLGNYNIDDFPISFSIASPPVCNDGTCNGAETCSSCPGDCACTSGICCSGTCTVPACSQASDCGSDSCMTYTCSNPGTCSASCSSVPKTCQSGDSCCPSGCTNYTDSDCSIIASDTILLYHFDEGSGAAAIDSSGNGNTGTISGASWTTGKFGGGLSFDGVNDYVGVADSPSLSFTNNALTITAWVKLNSLPAAETPILRKNSQWAMEMYNANTIRNLINTDGSGGWTSGNDENFAFQANTWYFWTFVYDGSKITHMINNQQVGSTHAVTGNIVDNSNPVEMGRYNGYLNGTIDEIRIYNRALSSQEISDLYNQNQCIHEADNNPCNGCISQLELINYINRWKVNNLDVTMAEMMDGIREWKMAGC